MSKMKKSFKKVLYSILTLAFVAFTMLPSIAFANPKPNNDLDTPDKPVHLGGLTLHKVDSITLEGLRHAVFELSDTQDFSGMVHILTTNDFGVAVQGGLVPGTWYLREKTAPEGYIPYEGVVPVSIGPCMKSLTLKDTAYGRIKICKVDDCNQPVPGCVFSLYKGSDTLPEHLLFDNLVSDSNGIVNIPNLIPGFYTLLETSVPHGYHLNDTPVTKEVTAGHETIFRIENRKIRHCHLNLYKKDAESGQQLAGAVFGVYSDPDFTNLIAEVTSLENGPISVNDLEPGTYYVKELAVPAGYLLDAAPQTVVLHEGETAEVTFRNNRDYPTAGNFGMVLVIGTGMMTLCGAAALLGRKYLKKER